MLGRKWGALVLVLDVLKAYLPTLVVLRTMGTVPALVAGFSVVLGHVFSPFLRGRGGKGVACALGTVLAVEPFVGLGALVVFGLVKIVVPFVGEASVVTMGLVAVVGVLAALGVRAVRRAGRRGVAGGHRGARAVAAPAQHRGLVEAAPGLSPSAVHRAVLADGVVHRFSRGAEAGARSS